MFPLVQKTAKFYPKRNLKTMSFWHKVYTDFYLFQPIEHSEIISVYFMKYPLYKQMCTIIYTKELCALDKIWYT